MGGLKLFRGDVLDAYRSWPAPATIVSDGAYGVRGFHGNTSAPTPSPALVPPAHRVLVGGRGTGHHAVVLEHRDRLGQRASGARRARLDTSS